MSKTGLFDHIGQDHIFLSVDAAVQAFLSRPAAALLRHCPQPTRPLSLPHDSEARAGYRDASKAKTAKHLSGRPQPAVEGRGSGCTKAASFD